ncbi:MAG: DsbA family oxidoreductase [Gemmatimonas sp.]|jgi:predicted DsbA family dithiol-disulfide isomerase|uniref:DsbA family oxidoreductase n=1 Tax=Gemmatimonas sp. TaxID=1962908 RepID=UPI00391F5645|nr:DsbA family oxidoreductase [Gemmatimonadota bacterium]
MGSTTTARTIALELYADLVCPWCWIGDRRLCAAIAQVQAAHPAVHFDLTWRPFQLDPTVPAAGRPWAEVIEQKFGGRANADPIFARVAEAGQADGIAFAFDRITTAPNTARGHGLVLHAQQTGRDPRPLVEALFAAYFADGEDLGNHNTLMRIAAAHGVPEAEAREVLRSGRYDVDVQQSQREAARLGIRGVPFLVLEGQYGVSGAQPVEVYTQALARVLLTA